MPQVSERQVLLNLLDDAIPLLRRSWRSLVFYLLVQFVISGAMEVYDLATEDGWEALVIAPLHAIVTERLLLIRRLQRLREQTMSQRYFEPRRAWRGLREERDAVMGRLVNQNDDWLRRIVRVDRRSFDSILSRIEGDAVFHNRSRNPQMPVKWQLMVALCRLGHDGNSIAVKMVASMFSISDGLALIALQQEYIHWPSNEEKQQIKTRFGRNSAFGHCIGIADGSLFPLALKPALRDDYVFFSRKHGYSINTLFTCDDTCRISFMSIGWGGSTHDSRVYKSTDEYLIADSGYQGVDAEYLVASYKTNVAADVPWEERQRFNVEIARVRVKAEHMFGMMKLRWQSLRGLRAMVQDERTSEQMVCWVRACAVLHNMLLARPDDSFWEGQDRMALEEMWEAEAIATRQGAEGPPAVGAGGGRQRRAGGGRGMVPDEGQRMRLRQYFTRNGYAHAY